MPRRKTEMTASFDSGKGNTLKIPLPKVEKKGKILEAYWTDEDGTKTTLLKHKSKAYVKIKGENLEGKKIVFKAYEFDTGESNDDFIHEHEWPFKGNEMTLSFNVTREMFVKGEEDLIHLYFTLSIEDADAEPFCNGDGKRLKVHVVRYVPEIMTSLGWDVGETLQEEWFKRKANSDPFITNPDLSLITMDWTLGFSPAKEVYDNMFTKKYWVTPNGKKGLVNELKRMVTDGKLTLPTKEKDSTEFGIFSKRIVTHKNKKIPLFDKYHYQEGPYVRGFWSNALVSNTDLTAALANFVFRMSAGGTITKTKAGYTVHITKVAVYVRDSFDYINEPDEDQPLGYWNIAKGQVSKTPGFGYRKITNSSYQNYRDEFNLGGDFRVFSDLKFTPVDDSFHVPVI